MVWDLESEIDLLRCAIAKFVRWDDPSNNGKSTEDGKDQSNGKEMSGSRDWDFIDDGDNLSEPSADSRSDPPSIEDAIKNFTLSTNGLPTIIRPSTVNISETLSTKKPVATRMPATPTNTEPSLKCKVQEDCLNPTIRNVYAHGSILNTEHLRLADEWEPQEGDIYPHSETLIDFVKDWGWSRNVDIKVRSSKMINPEKNLYVYFVCNREGSHNAQKSSDPEKTRDSKKSTRYNCLFGLNFTSPLEVRPGWRLSKIKSLEHNNHEPRQEVQMINRLASSMVDIIKEPAQTDSSIESTMVQLEQTFAKSNKFFNKQQIDARLKMYKNARRPPSQNAEATSLQAYLCTKMQKERWFFSSEVDEECCLDRLFWMSPGQVALYRRYHCVVVHDNTAKTNRLGMSLTCFVVVDSTNRTRLIACALSRLESQEYHA
ncbi:MAG: hypothetical protein J3R72DRAFT_128511 [Linnemannia gamsii]|nr:MAG: hypothetical protein J3R72DRAFT_128511 [Linnemannia gamsii]